MSTCYAHPDVPANASFYHPGLMQNVSVCEECAKLPVAKAAIPQPPLPSFRVEPPITPAVSPASPSSLEQALVVYAMFYPALRRLLKLGVALVVYIRPGMGPLEAWHEAGTFLESFDQERDNG